MSALPQPLDTDLRGGAVRELRLSGWTWPQIAAEIGMSVTTCQRLADPALAERTRIASRAAKRKRRGTCIDCGGETSYAGLPGKMFSERCRRCAIAAERGTRRGQGPRKTQILELVAEGRTFSEMREATGLPKEQLGAHLSKLKGYELIRKTGHGRYEIAA